MARAKPINRWQCLTIGRRGRRILHVHPLDDLRAHNLGRRLRCWCNPIETIEDGHVMVSHNAMDGRELVEQHGLQ